MSRADAAINSGELRLLEPRGGGYYVVTQPSHALCDIGTPQDVKTLVDAFYAKVNCDELLAPVFNETAQVDWAKHLPTMYRFWESLLFGSGNYQGAPFPKHAVLPVQQAHFERWLTLFAETIDENFAGPKSEEAKSRALCIADTFAHRMGVLTDPAALARILLPQPTAG